MIGSNKDVLYTLVNLLKDPTRNSNLYDVLRSLNIKDIQIKCLALQQIFLEYAFHKVLQQIFLEYAFHKSKSLKHVPNQQMILKKTNHKLKTLTVNEIGTPKPKEPKKALEDEFKDLHLRLPVLEVLAYALIYNAILDKYVESLELADLWSCVNLIPLYLFKNLKIRLLEETGHVFGLADGIKSSPVGIVKNVEVLMGKLKLLDDFYAIDMEKDPPCPLLIEREFLATASAVIDCKKAKITVGEGITRSRVKEINIGDMYPIGLP
nr:hypothetical protein [Tanacetum cinerariifolium]